MKSEAIFSLFNSGRWKDLNRSAFSTVRYLNLENLTFQHLPVRKKVKTHTKTKDSRKVIAWETV